MDIRAEVTERIIAMLESGAAKNVPPFQAFLSLGLPRNHATKATYTGSNVLTLWNAALERRYLVNEWLTFKQAEVLNAKIKKGAKGVMCCFYKKLTIEDDTKERHEQDAKVKQIPLLKPFWLFNVADVEGLPPMAQAVNTFDLIEDAEHILQASGAIIEHRDETPCYMRQADTIIMPHPKQYIKPESYYAHALHELTHWTGSPHRLNRTKGKRFGDLDYAFEELVAELGSAFLMAHLGIHDMTMDNHASYIDNWLEVLHNDKTAVFRASHLANEAFQYILKLSQVSAEVEA